MKPSLAAIACWALLTGTAAQGDTGLGRVHAFKDWVVGCDNTRQCEAQGYAAEADGVPSSELAALIVARGAGPRRLPRLRFAYSRFNVDAVVPGPGDVVTVQAGALRFLLPPPAKGSAESAVPPQHAAALLAWLLKGDQIRLSTKSRAWSVSLAGASAALLKMDELQGRLGTPGALVRKGARPESAVPAPVLPMVRPAPVPITTPSDLKLEPRLRAALRASDSACPDFEPHRALDEPVRLTPTTLLVSQPCWRGAYQTSSRLWMADDKPPYRARPVKLPEPDGDAGDDTLVIEMISATHGRLTVREAAKERGVGDCWTGREWTWTGKGFELLSAWESYCKAFEAGGLPITLWRTRTR